MKTFLNKPGISLLVVGVVLAFIIRPFIGGVWVVGGFLSPLAFFLGIFAIIGGVYLLMRSKLGPT